MGGSPWMQNSLSAIKLTFHLAISSLEQSRRGLHDERRRNGVRRRYGRSWHAPPLQQAYHRRSQSLARVVNFLLTLSVTMVYVRDQRQRAQRTKRCETSAHALLSRGGHNGPVYPSAKT